MSRTWIRIENLPKDCTERDLRSLVGTSFQRLCTEIGGAKNNIVNIQIKTNELANALRKLDGKLWARSVLTAYEVMPDQDRWDYSITHLSSSSQESLLPPPRIEERQRSASMKPNLRISNFPLSTSHSDIENYLPEEIVKGMISFNAIDDAYELHAFLDNSFVCPPQFMKSPLFKNSRGDIRYLQTTVLS